MSKQTFAVFCAFSAVITAFAAMGPKIEFAEPVHDFGRVEYGRTFTNFFTFTNTGDQTLEISDVISSCGCVASTNWDRRVDPGKAGTIPVIFSASGVSENVQKPIRVISNDPIQSNAVLYVQAAMYKPIDAVPQLAMFRFGPDFQTNETRVIRLISNMEEPVELSDPVWTNRSFSAKLTTVKPGKEFELAVTVIPPLGPGSWFSPVIMKTSTPKMPEVKVTAYAMVQPAMTLTPHLIMLPSTPLPKPEEVTVSIQNNGTNSLVLSEPSINTPKAQVVLRELQTGRFFQLALTFPAGFRGEPGRAIEARLKSNNPQSPVIKIPIIESEPDSSASPEQPSAGR